MTTREQLETLYKDLNAPSATAFRRALARKGIPSRLKDIQEFVSSKSERQILAPPPKYEGKIVSHDIDHRWMADLISFTSRPATKSGVVYTYVLVVIDVFSRQVWTKALQTTAQTTAEFKSILRETKRSPGQLDTDGGNEFSAATFRALCKEYDIEHTIKDKDDKQAIATVDSVIGTIKRGIRRRVEQDGGSWLIHLEAVTKGYNDTPHSSTDAPPNAMSDSQIFSQHKKAAENMKMNAERMNKREMRLKKAGGFRTQVTKKTGLKRRVDSNLQ